MAIKWVDLELDLITFDERAALERLRARALDQFTLVTLEHLGTGAHQRKSLFELDRECANDVTDHGTFSSFQQYIVERIDADSFDPRIVVIALFGGKWVGMAAASAHFDAGVGTGAADAGVDSGVDPRDARADSRSGHGFLRDEMIGVLPEFRGRGLARALKTSNIRRMRMLGATSVRTRLNAANAAAIALNRSLGYVEP